MNRPGRQDLVDRIVEGQILAVVRAPAIPDAVALSAALADGGIPLVELTFTTPELPRHLQACAEAAEQTGVIVGAGTVLTAADARSAVDAGAQFLVTPGIGPDAAAIVATGHDAGVPVFLGALTPSEVMTATALGSDAVKIFPASRFGPAYLKDLRGPFPDVPLVPSGGVNASNARDFLAAGASVLCAGSNVVAPAVVAAGDWTTITAAAAAFRDSLSAS
jgi:2-dehydro-3-deoxyphosphogluconate aldolase/(4S)-4-hydroxy-2-oxoglutarate aldolase